MAAEAGRRRPGHSHLQEISPADVHSRIDPRMLLKNLFHARSLLLCDFSEKQRDRKRIQEAILNPMQTLLIQAEYSSHIL